MASNTRRYWVVFYNYTINYTTGTGMKSFSTAGDNHFNYPSVLEEIKKYLRKEYDTVKDINPMITGFQEFSSESDFREFTKDLE